MGLVLQLLCFCIIIFALLARRRKSSALPLPPGPPADPFIGHLRILPTEELAETLAAWSKTYGDVMHIRILNKHMIILNTVEAAIDLLEKRGSNYSDRPDFPIFRLMGWAPSLTFLRYGKQFQKHRRLMQQHLGKDKVLRYEQIQLLESRRLVVNLLECSDDNVDAMLHRYSTSIAFQVAYGHQILSNDDPYVHIITQNAIAITNCGPVGSTFVDLFPFLEYFPSWFPGAFFATKAKEYNPNTRKLHNYPFLEVKRELSEGRAPDSFLARHLERLQREGIQSEEEYEDIKGAAATIFGAGADTTWSTLSTFMLAMTLYPECVKRAQEEIDSVCGSRLPEVADRASLPYIECILQESYRWLNAVPLGVPHRAVSDDVYKGMFIPSGSLVIANVRGICLNESVYHDAHLFKPSRYLPKSQGGQGEPYPTAQFGFGRRICIGRHLADTTLWIAMATILTLLEIRKSVGPDGKEVIPIVGVVSGLTSHPKPYLCAVKLRNVEANKLVEEIKAELAVSMVSERTKE